MNAENPTPQVFYRTWMKALGIVGLPALAICALWLTFRPLLEDGLTIVQQVVFPLLGAAVLYQCYIGSRCLPYLNTVASLFNDGIEVRKGDVARHYKWNELDVVQFTFATTTQILTKDGSTVVYFSDGLPNLGLMTRMIASNNT